MKKLYTQLIVTLLTAISCVGNASAITNPTIPISQVKTTPPQPAQPVQNAQLWNLQDADILSVINEVALETGKNFVVDPRVSGKISLISSKPIKPDEVYSLFLSVLELLGYSAIPSGNVVKIVPNIESSEFATRVATAQAPGKGDEVVVRVIQLENVSANQLIPVIRPMLPQWSNVSSYTPGNTLILLGRAANLQRIANVIRSVDKASDSNIDVVTLRQASASQMATVLSNLQNNARMGGDAAQVSIAADERSNSILLSGNKFSRLRMRLLISQLDAPASSVQGNTEVVYLRYLKAKELAPLLGKIAENILKSGSTSTTPSNTAPSTFSPNSANAAKSKNQAPENATNIQAELGTNALIITAPPALMRSLKNIIAKLDLRPAQVMVEAIFVEIDEGDIKNLGIQWGGRTTNADISAVSATGFASLGLGSVGIIPGGQIQAILAILQNQTGANILSTPSIVVLDNHKATLAVGQKVPEQTGSYATTGGNSTVSPFNTTNYADVVLKLIVTPQINLGNAVRLGISLTNDTLQNPSNPGPTPTINTNQIQNSVLVNSKDILVIGGLISNNIIDQTQKVPILGDIPGLGLLFTQKSRNLQKKNLMIFIKPTILYNSDDATSITNTKYDLIRNAQINWPEDLSSEGKQKALNVLPLWKNNVQLPKPFESP